MGEIDISRIEDKLDVIHLYLKKHDIKVSDVEILDAAITLARRMGAGDWSFCCEFRNREK